MKKNDSSNSVWLSRQIFLYLLGVSMLSVLSLGLFWIQSRFNSYHKDIRTEKKIFSETKKIEIKNKILQIKSYINWIQSFPLKPLTQTLSNQLNQLKLPGKNITSVNFSDSFPKSYKDAIAHSRVPVYILNSQGTIVYTFNPLSASQSAKPNNLETILLTQCKKRIADDKGILSLYKRITESDSTLEIAGYFNNRLISGFSVVSMVQPNYFESILQMHILDSISKLRYTENEYVFINSLSGKAFITNGKSNEYPIDILSSGSSVWIKVFKMQQTASTKPEGVFHTYNWIKPSNAKPALKTSYFSYIPSWKWIIGTGFYEDDINAIIQLRKQKLEAEMHKAIRNILIYVLISTLLCYLLARYFSSKLGKNISLFQTFLVRVAKENILIDKSKVSYREFMFMADAANGMVCERKQIEETLRISENQLSAIFNNISDILYFIEVKPNEQYRFISVNEMFLKATGLKKNDVMYKSIQDVIPQPAHELVLGKYREAIETKQTVSWEEISVYPTGKKYGMVKITPIYNVQGICTNLVGSVHDITMIRETENEIRQLNVVLEKRVTERTAQLEAINKELEAFSYSVSHDLRAPLRHINGYLELLTKRNFLQLDDKGKHYIQSISEASNQMGILIDDLLNFSRTGRMEMKLDSIDMNRAINDALSILKQETRERKIEWKQTPMPNVYADYAMIRQVWTNLLGNAIKYTRKCDVAIIEIGSITTDLEYIFFVRDNGAGFDMNYAHKLFGVFQRLHANEDFEGTGIGLANVRQVISRHKGRTWAEGEIDKGAVFYFSLPKI